MNIEIKKELIEHYLSAYNSFDVEGMLEVLSDDVTFENVQGGEVNASANGKGEFAELAEQAKSLFSERTQKIESITEESEKVIVKIQYHGIVASDLPNGMKAGNEISLNGVSEFTFSNHQIISIRDIS